MTNIEIVNSMLSISKRIKPYIYVKGQLDTLYEVEMNYVKEPEVSVNMKKAIDSLAIKIKLAKSRVFELYRRLDGYNDSFNNIDYISSSDVEDGYIPVNNGHTYLKLDDGQFVVIEAED